MNLRFNYLLFGIACLSGIAVRTVMLLFIIDPVSGFIYTDYSTSSIGLIAILAAAGIFLFALSLFSKRNADATPKLSGIPFYVSLIIMAIAIFYETFFSPLLRQSGQVQAILQYLLTVGTMATFIFISVMGFLKKEFHPAISLVPIAFWTMRLIIVFTDFSTISTISETVIETLAMCLTLITFLLFAKLTCERISPKRYTLVAATALLNAYLCTIGSVPRLLSHLLSIEQPVHLNIVPAFTGFATAIFSATFAFTLLHSIQKKD